MNKNQITITMPVSQYNVLLEMLDGLEARIQDEQMAAQHHGNKSAAARGRSEVMRISRMIESLELAQKNRK